MAAGDDYGDCCEQAEDAVAAKTIAEKGGIIRSALDVIGSLEGFLDFAAELIRLVVEALLHQDDIDYVF